MEGWFKIYRQIFDGWVFSDPQALKIWIWLIGKARKNEGYLQAIIGKGETTVKLLPGQLLFGRFKAEEALSMDGSKIYRVLKKMEGDGMISVDSNSHYSIITLCNYEVYQGNGEGERTTNEQPMNNHCTADEQPLNINKNDKKVKSVKNNIYSADFLAFWDAYPRKEAKPDAFKSWQKAKDKPGLPEILSKLEAHKKTEQWQDRKFIPQPATYINKGRWFDEVKIVSNHPSFTY